MKKLRSIQYILISSMMLTAGIPLLFLSIILYTQVTSSFKGEIRASANLKMQYIANELERVDNESRQLIKLFASHSTVSDSQKNLQDSIGISTVLQSMEKGNRLGSRLVLDLDNGRTYSTLINRIAQSVDYEDMKLIWQKSARENPDDVQVVSNNARLLWKDSGELVYSKAVIAEDHSILGVASLHVPQRSLEQLLMTTMKDYNGFSVTYDPSQESLFYMSGLLPQENFNHNALRDRIQNADPKVLFSLGGSTYTIVKSKNAVTGWVIAVFTSNTQTSRKQFSFAITLASIAFVVLLIAFLVFGRIESKITQAVISTVSVMQSISSGNFYERIHYDSRVPHEIELVKDAFNTMAQQIQLQTEELISKSEEITGQYEEISSLYEESTALNDTLHDLVDQLNESYLLTISTLSSAIEANDPYTKGHCDRVSKYAQKLGARAGLTNDELHLLEFASQLHDIGKIGVPSEVIRKNGKLTAEEYALICQHPTIGYQIISKVPYLDACAEIMYQHHERYDGNGYPRGLKAQEISLSALILAIADAFDAMTSSRPYRINPMTHERALQALIEGKGSQFDSRLVDLFVEIAGNGELVEDAHQHTAQVI